MTLKTYGIIQRAWLEHPPVDWLKAAELGYKSPEQSFNKSIDNTRMMFDMIRGMESVARKKVEGGGGSRS